jgi:hypothetical protein
MVVWLEFDEPVPGEKVRELGLTATRGSFAWLAHPNPIAQIAVACEPNGQVVNVGGTAVSLTGVETHLGSVALGSPVVDSSIAELDGGRGWPVQSDQFCDVKLSNVVLEFSA